MNKVLVISTTINSSIQTTTPTTSKTIINNKNRTTWALTTFRYLHVTEKPMHEDPLLDEREPIPFP